MTDKYKYTRLEKAQTCSDCGIIMDGGDEAVIWGQFHGHYICAKCCCNILERQRNKAEQAHKSIYEERNLLAQEVFKLRDENAQLTHEWKTIELTRITNYTNKKLLDLICGEGEYIDHQGWLYKMTREELYFRLDTWLNKTEEE